MEIQVEGMTLGSVVREVAKERSEACFLTWEAGSYTYGEFLKRVERIAKGLLDCGVRHGDKVALWAGNRPEWIECYLAVVSIGAVLVTVNTRYRSEELLFELKQSDARFILMEQCFLKEDLLDRALAILPELKHQRFGCIESKTLPCFKGVILIDDAKYPGMTSLKEVVDGGKKVSDDMFEHALRSVKPEDVALMIYTSGTTGNPKGVEQQHGALLNRMQRFVQWNHMDVNDVTFFALPLFHSFGAVVSVIGTLVTGSRLCIREKFRPREALETIERERCSVIHGVPSSFYMMLQDPDFDDFDLSSGRTGVLGGAPCAPELARRIMEGIAPAITTAWGLTESCGMVTASALGDTPEQVTRTVGRVIPGSEVVVADPETGARKDTGECGEVLVRSPFNMRGYYRMEEATREAFDDEGWLHTGDRGFFDEEGCLRITGRLTDMFIVGGVNAYPMEIESLIRSFEGVEDVQVVGVPDVRLGEVACAYIIKKNKGSIAAEAVIEQCRGLANYKIPRFVEFIDEFPMTANGKVKKYVLKEMFAQRDSRREVDERRSMRI